MMTTAAILFASTAVFGQMRETGELRWNQSGSQLAVCEQAFPRGSGPSVDKIIVRRGANLERIGVITNASNPQWGRDDCLWSETSSHEGVYLSVCRFRTTGGGRGVIDLSSADELVDCWGVSPDGRSIAWVLVPPDLGKSILCVMPLDRKGAKKSLRLLNYFPGELHLSWCDDSNHLVFARARQVFAIDARLNKPPVRIATTRSAVERIKAVGTNSAVVESRLGVGFVSGSRYRELAGAGSSLQDAAAGLVAVTSRGAKAGPFLLTVKLIRSGRTVFTAPVAGSAIGGLASMTPVGPKVAWVNPEGACTVKQLASEELLQGSSGLVAYGRRRGTR